jgi:hypothetical protein
MRALFNERVETNVSSVAVFGYGTQSGCVHADVDRAGGDGGDFLPSGPKAETAAMTAELGRE